MQDVEQRARAFMEALSALEAGGEAEVAAIAGLFAEDAELHNAALDLRDGELVGRARIAEFWAQYREQLGRARTKFHELTAGGRSAGVFWTTEGQDAQGGPIHYHGCTLLRFDEQGQVAYFRGYYDTRRLQMRARAGGEDGR